MAYGVDTVGFYSWRYLYLKIFFPQFVIEVAQIDSITRIGHYIDTHKWAWYVATFAFSFIAYYFVCCASCKRQKLNIKEIGIIVATIVLLFIIKEFLPYQYTAVNISSLILLPYIMKGDFKATVSFTGSNAAGTNTGITSTITS